MEIKGHGFIRYIEIWIDFWKVARMVSFGNFEKWLHWKVGSLVSFDDFCLLEQ